MLKPGERADVAIWADDSGCWMTRRDDPILVYLKSSAVNAAATSSMSISSATTYSDAKLCMSIVSA